MNKARDHSEGCWFIEKTLSPHFTVLRGIRESITFAKQMSLLSLICLSLQQDTLLSLRNTHVKINITCDFFKSAFLMIGGRFFFSCEPLKTKHTFQSFGKVMVIVRGFMKLQDSKSCLYPRKDCLSSRVSCVWLIQW